MDNTITKTKERSSNFELLRIFCVLAIISAHFINQSSMEEYNNIF